MILSFNLLGEFWMAWFSKKETSEDTAAASAGVSASAAKKISLNFRGLSSAAVRDMGRSTIGEVAVMPDLRGVATNDNISSVFNGVAAAAFSRPAPPSRPLPPKGPAP